MTAPERIALRWELGAAVTRGPLMDHPDYTQYVRADLIPAALAVPEVRALVEAAEALMTETASIHDALWEVINERRDDPIETPEPPAEVANMRAALAALRGEGGNG